MGKLPYFQFYPGDWLRDAVAGCSMAAQGFWLRVLIIMHDSERYGFLEENNKPISIEKIVARVGCSGGVTEALQLWDELVTAGVIRCDKRGIFYSKRMVEDDKKRAQGRARTRKHRTSVTLSKRSCNALVTPMSQGSSSSSSSSDLSCLSSSTISLPKGTETHLNGVIETVPQDDPTSNLEVVRTGKTRPTYGVLQEPMEAWIRFRKELKKPLTQSSIEQLVRNYSKDPVRFAQAVEFTIGQCWQGLKHPSEVGYSAPATNGYGHGPRSETASERRRRESNEHIKNLANGGKDDDQDRDGQTIEVDFKHVS